METEAGPGPFSVQLPAVCRTCDNLAIDTAPSFSPVSEDTFAYLSTRVMGYESDRRSVKLMDGSGAPPADLTADWTHSVDSAVWSAAGGGLYLGISRDARYTVEFLDVTTRVSTPIPTVPGAPSGAQPIANGSLIIYSVSSYQSPSSIVVQKPDGSAAVDLTAGFNFVALSKLQRSPTEQFRFNGSVAGSTVQSWFFKPAGGFEDGKKYPLVYLIHGGPQQAWFDSWSFRWNPQIWTAAGFAVAMVNFHGSNSFGQEFTDSITGNYVRPTRGHTAGRREARRWLADERAGAIVVAVAQCAALVLTRLLSLTIVCTCRSPVPRRFAGHPSLHGPHARPRLLPQRLALRRQPRPREARSGGSVVRRVG